MRRAGIVVATAAVLTVGTLAAVNGTAQATVTTPPTQPANTTGLPPGGLLTLTTAGGNVTSGTVTYSTFTGTTPTTQATQTLTANANCYLVSDQSLLAISGSTTTPPTVAPPVAGNYAGFRLGSIGVRDSATGVSCGRASASTESLKLDVAVGRPSAATQPVATSAYLDLELKSSAAITATVSLGGVPKGSFLLTSGRSNTIVPPAGTPVTRCSSMDDSGPDDHELDNCRWPISVPSWLGADDGIAFDSITLTPTVGSFSLEGGADGLVAPLPPVGFPTKGSFFELAGGVVSCDASTVSLPQDTATNTPAVSIKLLDTLANGQPCGTGAVPYTLTNGPGSITFLKNLSQQPLAQFIVNPTWVIPVPAGPATLSVTKVIFPNGGPQDLGWCPAPTFSGSTLTGITNPLAAPDMDNVTPGIQFACLGSTASIFDPSDTTKLDVTEQIYLEGDVKFTR